MKAIDLGLPSGLKWADCNVGLKKKQTYEFEVSTTMRLDINFEDIYRTVVEEMGTNDPSIISLEFGDNVLSYLKRLSGSKLDNVMFDDLSLDLIADDFEAYVDGLYADYEDYTI